MSVQEAVLTSHSSLQLIILTTHRSMDMRRHMSKGTKNMLFIIRYFFSGVAGGDVILIRSVATIIGAVRRMRIVLKVSKVDQEVKSLFYPRPGM